MFELPLSFSARDRNFIKNTNLPSVSSHFNVNYEV